MTDDRFRPFTPENEGPPEFLVTLGLVPPVSVEDVETAYRAKAQAVHSDHGGSDAEFKVLQTAYERAKEYAAFREGRRKWMADQVEPYLRQQEIAEELEARGATVDLKHTDWLNRSFGEGFATLVDKIAGVSMSDPKFVDDDLQYLVRQAKDLQSLRKLDLSNSSITDAALPLIAKLGGLRSLDLSHTGVGPTTLAMAKDLPSLQKLNITGTQVGIWHRMRLKALHRGLEIIH